MIGNLRFRPDWLNRRAGRAASPPSATGSAKANEVPTHTHTHTHTHTLVPGLCSLVSTRMALLFPLSYRSHHGHLALSSLRGQPDGNAHRRRLRRARLVKSIHLKQPTNLDYPTIAQHLFFVFFLRSVSFSFQLAIVAKSGRRTAKFFVGVVCGVLDNLVTICASML